MINRQSGVSWVLLKISNEVGSVFFWSKTGERHLVTWNVLSWVEQVNEQVLFWPLETSSLEGFTGWEVSASSLSTNNTTESWTSRVLIITLILIDNLQPKRDRHHSFLQRRLFPKQHLRLERWLLVPLSTSSFFHPFCILINKNYNFVDYSWNLYLFKQKLKLFHENILRNSFTCPIIKNRDIWQIKSLSWNKYKNIEYFLNKVSINVFLIRIKILWLI